MTDFLRLPALGPESTVHVVVESPKGATAKFKYEPALGAFGYSRSLAAGVSYPFDWGFVPSTRAEDGDPLDGMVLNDLPTSTGTIVRCRAVGLLEVHQTEQGVTRRNDRLFFAPAGPSRALALSRSLQRQLEQFFLAATFGTGKELRFGGWRDGEAAMECLEMAMKAFAPRAD